MTHCYLFAHSIIPLYAEGVDADQDGLHGYLLISPDQSYHLFIRQMIIKGFVFCYFTLRLCL